MLTSKELLGKARISRATLNNYIGLGILPRPIVRKPLDDRERARQLGYFPDDALERIETVRRLKKQGLRITEIAARFREGTVVAPAAAERRHERRDDGRPVAQGDTPDRDAPSLEDLEHPAYMVNYDFEIEWLNESAANSVFGLSMARLSETAAPSFFRLILESPVVRRCEDRDKLLAFHLAIAKTKLSRRAFARLEADIGPADRGRLEELYDQTGPARPGPLAHARVNMAEPFGEPAWYNVYVIYFREGVLFIHLPADVPAESVLHSLAARDRILGELYKSRRPRFVPMCVLVAELDEWARIRAELPTEEYFELIDQIWRTAETVLRKYHATPGRHAGNGTLFCFRPRPGRSYILDACLSAKELTEKMRGISKEWQLRKNWTNELYLNVGLNEGEEWFGTHENAHSLEFAGLGDTISLAGRLCDFARFGAVWVTKNLMGKLRPEEREMLRFGIRRINAEGREVFAPATYSRLSNLIELGNERYENFRDIATLAITEVVEVAAGNRRLQPQGRI